MDDTAATTELAGQPALHGRKRLGDPFSISKVPGQPNREFLLPQPCPIFFTQLANLSERRSASSQLLWSAAERTRRGRSKGYFAVSTSESRIDQYLGLR